MKRAKFLTSIAATSALALVFAASATAHQTPPSGECVSIQQSGSTVTAQVTGPADVEAWLRDATGWHRTPATIGGLTVANGYRWVPVAAQVVVQLPPDYQELKIAVWSTKDQANTCYVTKPPKSENSTEVTPPAPTPATVAIPPPLTPTGVRSAGPTPVVPLARVTVRKSGPARVRSGITTTYRITVRNTSARTVRVTVSDRLPRALVLRSLPSGWSVSGSQVRISVTLRAGQKRTLGLPVRVLSSASGRHCNVAMVTGPRVRSASSRVCTVVVRQLVKVLPAVTG
jgi:uncharacterized repeat protein (TIGR01451 family)